MAIAMVMVPRVTPNYAKWWTMMCPSPLQLDNLDSDNDGLEATQPSEEDDQMDMENSIHDGPPLARGFDVLAVATTTPSNKLYS